MPHPPEGGMIVFGPQVSVKIASLLEQPEPLAGICRRMCLSLVSPPSLTPSVPYVNLPP